MSGVKRLAAEMRQIANAHTIFSVGCTLVLIWFTPPLGRLAKMIAQAPARSAGSRPSRWWRIWV